MKPYRFFILTATFLTVAAQLFAQTETRYTVSFPNAVHHEAQIVAEFSGVQKPVLEVRMSRSSPGRYALHEFAKNVYAVKAENSKGQPLQIYRPDPSQWNVSGHDGTVKITYTLFGDRADGTYAGIDETHAHLNAPATFMYAYGFEEKPSQILFDLPAGKNWKIATQLRPETTLNLFSAPNLQYLMDSPTELADAMWREWQITDKEKTRTFRFALHHPGTAAEFDSYTEQTQKIVQEAKAVFGELPDYDFGTYTFIGCYAPQAARDGMEHRNSTSLTSPKPLKTAAIDNLGTVAHEFFHSWNVERIRPKSLEPFNFEKANMSESLWFAEGFTNYYGDLLLCRSGAISQDEYLKVLGADLNSFLQQPGKDFYSPIEMSQQAPFVDAARSVDPVNRINTYVSYYTYGEVLAAGLDLMLRSRYSVSLDDYMRAVWLAHGKNEKPYQLTDLENILGQVTKDPDFARLFFQKHIYGHEPIDYKTLLHEAGLDLKAARPGEASLGYAPLAYQNERAVMQTGSLLGSPLYAAGVEFEDAILKLDGKKLRTSKDLQKILKKHKPGDVISLEYEQRNQIKKVKITLIEDPRQEIAKLENQKNQLTDKAKQLRSAWLGP